MKGSRESPTCAFHAHAHPSATSIQAAALRNGSLLLNMRSRELRRLQSYSHDGGESWSPPRPARPPVPDGNCQGSQISLGDGSVLVATSAGPARVGLHAYVSPADATAPTATPIAAPTAAPAVAAPVAA